MGPLFPQELVSNEINILIGFIIGIGFGFLLEASGFTNTRKLAGVFYGYDVTVIKVFFTAAITALLGLFIMHYMGWIDITIDIGVAISAAIVLGVAVDDSIHFFSKYFYAKNKLNLKIEERFIYVLKYAGTAILFTTIILVISFLLFLGSDFTPNYNFGIITAIALIIALIADLLLLPSLLLLVDKE